VRCFSCLKTDWLPYYGMIAGSVRHKPGLKESAEGYPSILRSAKILQIV